MGNNKPNLLESCWFFSASIRSAFISKTRARQQFISKVPDRTFTCNIFKKYISKLRSQDDVIRVAGNRGAFHGRVLLVEGDQRVHFFHVTRIDRIGDDTLNARIELQGMKPRAQRRLVAGEKLNER